MLIRSQGKGRLINLGNVKDIEISEYERKKDDSGKEYYAYGEIKPNIYMIQADGFNLGEYYSMEKAVKVLDMICKEHEKYATIQTSDGIQGLFKYPKVFQMPQDEEVEG